MSALVIAVTWTAALAGSEVVGAATGKHAEAAFDPSASPGVVDAATVVPSLLVEIKYATADNFLGRSVYGDLKKCYLQKDAAEMLKKAAELLKVRAPDLRLLAYDCARPRRV
jgi:D-alanyl-D-alanine dipeptidase